MRVKYLEGKNQQFLLYILLILFLLAAGCKRSSEDLPVIPPSNRPLARDYIGFGVVNVSFTHLMSESGPNGVSHAYLRGGTVVRILERIKINNHGSPESWVLAESNYRGPGQTSSGWLEESALDVYENESQANTASKTMNQ